MTLNQLHSFPWGSAITRHSIRGAQIILSVTENSFNILTPQKRYLLELRTRVLWPLWEGGMSPSGFLALTVLESLGMSCSRCEVAYMRPMPLSISLPLA